MSMHFWKSAKSCARSSLSWSVAKTRKNSALRFARAKLSTRQRQLSLETSTYDEAVKKTVEMHKELIKLGKASQLKTSQRYLASWFPSLANAVLREQEAVTSGVASVDRKLY